MFEIKVEDSFSAAHRLRDYQGKCESLHGHNWKVAVKISGRRLNEAGMLMDFQKVKSLLEGILQQLDHRCLNDVPPFDRVNPTSESLAAFIFKQLSAALDSSRCCLAEVTVWEGEKTSATFRDTDEK